MHIEAFRDYCLNKKGVEETTPFGPDTLVYKVMGKMFAATGLDDEEFRVNLKCNPDYALELRGLHDDIIPGWHMNKKHWNTIYFEKGLDDNFLKSLIDHSYDLVVASLTRQLKQDLTNLKDQEFEN